MCCDGSLFTRVNLADAERARLGDRIALRPNPDGPPFLKQPCKALDGMKCTVYRDRPEGCCVYKCAVLLGLEAGELTAEEAQGEVARAKELLEAVEATLPARQEGEPEGTMARARVLMETIGEQGLGEAVNESVLRWRRFSLLHFGA